MLLTKIKFFVCLFLPGIKSFADKDYQAATYHFEKSLMEFYKAEEECRAMCEGEYDGGEEYLDEVTSFHYQTVGKMMVKWSAAWLSN